MANTATQLQSKAADAWNDIDTELMVANIKRYQTHRGRTLLLRVGTARMLPEAFLTAQPT